MWQLIIPVVLKNATKVISALRSSKNHKDIHAAMIIDNSVQQIERIVQAKAYLQSGKVQLTPDLELLFGMFLNEAQRTAENSMKAAAAIADAEDIDVQSIIDEAHAEIMKSLGEHGSGTQAG